MIRKSTGVVGVVNFITFVLSIPILGAGIWLSVQAKSTDCLRFLQWPLIVIGLTVMVISLAGFAGACYRISWLLQLYLVAMFVVIVALLFFVVFAYSVTDHGRGEVVFDRGFLEYQLSDYSGWLKDRVSDPGYWSKISACLRDAHACRGMARYVRNTDTGLVVHEPASVFYQRDLSPVQSGCCKPPTSCGYAYANETVWNPGSGSTPSTDPDCSRWSNDQRTLCFRCDSCKAGVLATIRRSWRKASVVNIVVLVVLVIVYIVGFAAYRNARRSDNDEPFGESRMTKARPSSFRFF